jgi:hypothetical protein
VSLRVSTEVIAVAEYLFSKAIIAFGATIPETGGRASG